MTKHQLAPSVLKLITKTAIGLIVVVAINSASLLGAFAQETPMNGAPGSIRVGTRIVKPFVMQENGALTGFSIELWRELTTIAGLPFEFNVHTSLADLLSGVQTGPDDAAIAAISINAQREKVIDFSLPIFKSGLGILVPESAPPGILSVLGNYLNQNFFKYILLFVAIMAIPAHIIWFVERNDCDENDIPISSSYYPGILQALYWAMATTGGQAEGYPKSWVSRIVSLICIYASIIFVTIFTAYATTGMTLQRLAGDISSPRDLVGKRVATVKDSTAAHYLHDMGIKTVDSANIDDAIRVIEEKNADAVVYDAPMLLYYVGHEGDGKFRMAGDVFAEQNYSIAFKISSPLRKKVNSALLEFHDNGGYDKLYKKWFGSAQEGASPH